MKTGIFDQSHLAVLKRAVDVYARRHRVTATNISNVETPGYQAQRLKFEEMLQGADARLAGVRTHPGHLPIGAGGLEETAPRTLETGSDYDNGVNNVDIDSEMTTLATNDLSYRMATRLLSMRYSVLRGAIKGRVG
jgi:flagellar basal-body rod protein FlgB